MGTSDSSRPITRLMEAMASQHPHAKFDYHLCHMADGLERCGIADIIGARYADKSEESQ